MSLAPVWCHTTRHCSEMFQAFLCPAGTSQRRFEHDRLWLVCVCSVCAGYDGCDVVSKALNDQRGSRNRRFIEPHYCALPPAFEVCSKSLTARSKSLISQSLGNKASGCSRTG